MSKMNDTKSLAIKVIAVACVGCLFFTIAHISAHSFVGWLF